MKWAVAVFLILQALDLGITIWTIQICGDPTIEANPLARLVIVQAGSGGLVCLKTVGLIFFAIVMRGLPGATQQRVMDFGNGVMLIVVVVNIISLSHALGA